MSAASAKRLSEIAPDRCDLAIMIGDGLSAAAVDAHAVALISAFVPLASNDGLTLGPVVLAEGARVALGDVVGAALARGWPLC